MFVIGTKWTPDLDTQQENIKRASNGQSDGVSSTGISLVVYYKLVGWCWVVLTSIAICLFFLAHGWCLFAMTSITFWWQWFILLLQQKKKPLLIVAADLESEALAIPWFSTSFVQALRLALSVYILLLLGLSSDFSNWHEM